MNEFNIKNTYISCSPEERKTNVNKAISAIISRTPSVPQPPSVTTKSKCSSEK